MPISVICRRAEGQPLESSAHESVRNCRAKSERKKVAGDFERLDIVDLGPFENNRNTVLSINDRAQFAGVSLNEVNGRIEGFRQEGEARTMLGTLGGSFSIAPDLNNKGEVVGGSLTEGDNLYHGFIYRNNRLRDLNEFVEPGGS